jgi:hypothetical protein
MHEGNDNDDHDACTSICSHKPRNNLSAIGIYGGIHTFSHIQ